MVVLLLLFFNTLLADLPQTALAAVVIAAAFSLADVETLHRLDLEPNQRGVSLALVELRSRLHDLIDRYGLYDTLDRDHFYPTVEAALTAIGETTASEVTGGEQP